MLYLKHNVNTNPKQEPHSKNVDCQTDLCVDETSNVSDNVESVSEKLIESSLVCCKTHWITRAVNELYSKFEYIFEYKNPPPEIGL